MATIKIGGKDIELALNMEAYEEVCKRGHYTEVIDEQLAGPEQVSVLQEMISILGTCGTGEPVTVEWVKANLQFSEFFRAKNAVVATIVKAMHSETAEESQKTEVVDAVLEELDKKKEPTA